MRYLAIMLLGLLGGCAFNPHVTVYGTTGKQYVAPDLCAAIIQCQQSGETACHYNSSTIQDAQGRLFTDSCKVAK